MSIDKKTERITARLSKSQKAEIDKKIKISGLSFSELVEKLILNNEEKSNEVLDSIAWESSNLLESFNKSFVNHTTLIKKELADFYANRNGDYAYFNELNINKKDIDSYKIGDKIRTESNFGVVITGVLKESNEIIVTLDPLVKDIETGELIFKRFHVKNDSDKFQKVYRKA